MTAAAHPDDVASAVARAYEVFGAYALDGTLEVCRCSLCIDAEVERDLVATPLRAISWELLAQYTHSAHEWNDVVARQLRYFLPRYFELMAAGTDPCYYGNCLSRLGNVTYRRDWPAAEADAIDAFFVARLRRCLSTASAPLPPPGPWLDDADEVEEILIGMATAGGEIAVLLREWDGLRVRAATIRLASLILSADWTGRRLPDDAWLDHGRPTARTQMERVFQWMARAETRERLEAAWMQEDDPASAGVLSRAEAIVAGPAAKTLRE